MSDSNLSEKVTLKSFEEQVLAPSLHNKGFLEKCQGVNNNNKVNTLSLWLRENHVRFKISKGSISEIMYYCNYHKANPFLV